MSAGINLYKNGKIEIDGQIFYQPGSPTYEEFHRDLTTPNILLFGRRGSGKSYAVRNQLHRLSLMWPGFKYLVARNSLPELKRTHLKFLESEMKALGGEFNRTEGETRYSNGSVGQFVGFSTETDALKLLGAELDCLVIEEGTTVNWQVITDLASTLRTLKGSGRIPQLIIPTNPYGPHAQPIKRRWIDQDLSQEEETGYDPKEWRAIGTLAEDNPHLDFQSYDKRLGGLQANKRKAWLLGEWSSTEGSFFEDFDPSRHVISRLPEINGRSIFRNLDIPVYRAIDWGFSDDPCICLWIAVLPNGRSIVIKEMQWKRTPATEVAHEIIGHSREMNIAQTFCDPTMDNGKRAGAQSVLDLFELSGVPLTPSVNDRRLYSIHELLTTTIDSTPSLQFWQEGCPKLISTIQQQTPNSKDPERMADSKTDHHTLALSYFCSGWTSGHEPMKPEKPIPAWLIKLHQLNGERRLLGWDSIRK